jgi:Zinc knuckle
LESKCQDKANVREFLDGLRVKREELAAVGVDIEEKDYRSTILSSLPVLLANFALAQLAAARMYSPTKTLDPDVLISLIGEGFDRQKMQRSCRYGGKAKDDDSKDEAMAVNPGSSKGKGGKGGTRKPRGKCWNCGEKGHFKDKCPKPSKSKDDTKGKDKKKEKASGSANAAVEHNSDSESEGAWVAVGSDDEMALSDDGSMPNLEAVSDSSSECSNNLSSNEGWFSEAGDNGSELDDVEWRSDDLPEEVLVATTPARPGQYSYVRAELYGSGCTQHIFPFHEDFINFSEIPPKTFHAANKVQQEEARWLLTYL